MRKVKIILNPTAGIGAGARSLPGIESALTAQALDYDIVQSEYPRHAVELAKEAARTDGEILCIDG